RAVGQYLDAERRAFVEEVLQRASLARPSQETILVVDPVQKMLPRPTQVGVNNERSPSKLSVSSREIRDQCGLAFLRSGTRDEEYLRPGLHRSEFELGDECHERLDFGR